MTIPFFDSGPTSNDLLESLATQYASAELTYQVIAQSADEVQKLDNAPAVSMERFLHSSGQRKLLTAISVYSLRGESREQLRLLYMNPMALQVWREMGKAPHIVGALPRPPRAALLAFGVPFSK